VLRYRANNKNKCNQIDRCREGGRERGSGRRQKEEEEIAS
jgi:hypothetical protein